MKFKKEMCKNGVDRIKKIIVKCAVLVFLLPLFYLNSCGSCSTVPEEGSATGQLGTLSYETRVYVPDAYTADVDQQLEVQFIWNGDLPIDTLSPYPVIYWYVDDPDDWADDPDIDPDESGNDNIGGVSLQDSISEIKFGESNIVTNILEAKPSGTLWHLGDNYKVWVLAGMSDWSVSQYETIAPKKYENYIYLWWRMRISYDYMEGREIDFSDVESAFNGTSYGSYDPNANAFIEFKNNNEYIFTDDINIPQRDFDSLPQAIAFIDTYREYIPTYPVYIAGVNERTDAPPNTMGETITLNGFHHPFNPATAAFVYVKRIRGSFSSEVADRIIRWMVVHELGHHIGNLSDSAYTHDNDLCIMSELLTNRMGSLTNYDPFFCSLCISQLRNSINNPPGLYSGVSLIDGKAGRRKRERVQFFKEKDGVELKLYLLRDTYFVYEPIWFRLVMRNKREDTLKVSYDPEVSATGNTSFSVFLMDSTGKKYYDVISDLIGLPPAPVRKIPPMDSLVFYSSPLKTGRYKLNPGKYFIYGIYQKRYRIKDVWSYPMVTDTLILYVKIPTGREFEVYKKLDYAITKFPIGEISLEERDNIIKEIVKNYPDSRYVKMLYFYFGYLFYKRTLDGLKKYPNYWGYAEYILKTPESSVSRLEKIINTLPGTLAERVARIRLKEIKRREK